MTISAVYSRSFSDLCFKLTTVLRHKESNFIPVEIS